jgi:hypothetical protein
VAHQRFGLAVNRLDRGSVRAPVLRTPADVLKRLGRAVLWLLVIVLLLRGLASLFATDTPRATTPKRATAAAPVWPDDEARTFAAGFARAYLGYSPKRPDDLGRFVAPELVDTVAPDVPDGVKPATVANVSVARTAKLDAEHALVTVAAVVNGETHYLAVPVARDARGGLVVSDPPSLVAPPARGVVDAPELEPVAAGEQAGIEDVLQRFFSAYLAGDARGLTYLLTPGTRVGALAQRYELLSVTSLALAAPAKGDRRVVWATVRARDAGTKASYGLRYRVTLVRSDRWYVAAVNSAGG